MQLYGIIQKKSGVIIDGLKKPVSDIAEKEEDVSETY